MINLQKFTYKAQEAIADAQSQADSMNHAQIDPIHLLNALLNQDQGIIEPILSRTGVNVRQLRLELQSDLQSRPKVSGGANPELSPSLRSVLETAITQAGQMNDEYVAADHLLLAIAKEGKEVSQTLKKYGASYQNLLRAVADIRGMHKVDDPSAEEKFQALKKNTRDLTQ